MYFVFDTETSGLPLSRFPKYHDLAAYDGCRIVSICWMVLDSNGTKVESEYHVIDPLSGGFTVPIEASRIHGISDEDARRDGVPFVSIVNKLAASLGRCKIMVAHNVSFDFGVLLSEMHRIHSFPVINQLFRIERVCTMKKGKEVLGLKRWPKLADMYKQLTGKDMVGAHNARIDTECCAECFLMLQKADAEAEAATASASTSTTAEAESKIPMITTDEHIVEKIETVDAVTNIYNSLMSEFYR